MKTFFECLPCFVNQALSSLKRANASDTDIKNAMRTVFCELAAIDFNETPPVMVSKIYRIVNTVIKGYDSYADEKARYNELALQILPEIIRYIETTEDHFYEKIKFAIAANIIDFGKNDSLQCREVKRHFQAAQRARIDRDAVTRLRDAVFEAEKILYLFDNAGEIVFDRLLIEELPYQKIIGVVRGAPVINDATFQDAEAVGLTDRITVISNGSDAPGTVLADCSLEFKEAFDDADLIIAKGQGNFETLSHRTDKNIFFLFQVKCPVIARDCGFPIGTFVIKKNAHNMDK